MPFPLSVIGLSVDVWLSFVQSFVGGSLLGQGSASFPSGMGNQCCLNVGCDAW